MRGKFYPLNTLQYKMDPNVGGHLVRIRYYSMIECSTKYFELLCIQITVTYKLRF